MDTPARPRAVPRHVRAVRRTFAAVAIIAVGAIVATGSLAFEPEEARAQVTTSSLTESVYLGALGGFTEKRRQAFGAIAVAESVVASARLALDTSSGKVLNQTARTALLTQIRIEEARVASATHEVEMGNRLIDPSFRPGSYFAARPGLHAQTVALGAYRFRAASGLVIGRERLAAPVKTVRDAVAAWTTEQKRIAAEKARLAAERATRLAALAAAGPSSVRASVAWSVPLRPGGPRVKAAGKRLPVFNKYVRTYGWQAEIDACRGAVDISAHYGVAVIAEHWRCGGSSFPRAGTTITLSGVRAGTYRVGSVVAVLNVAKDGTSKVPRGYGLLYQTCINGNNKTMAFTALTRIGG